MTEAEWLSLDNAGVILSYAPRDGAGIDRRLRLYRCALLRWAVPVLPGEGVEQFVAAAEDLADGLAPPDTVRAAEHRADALVARIGRDLTYPNWVDAHVVALTFRDLLRPDPAGRPDEGLTDRLLNAAIHTEVGVTVHTGRLNTSAEFPRAAVAYVRCVFGNRPPPALAAVSEWATSTVTTLARQMYDTRDFDPMPILADALQDSGCDDVVVLDHCRAAGPHVRGCWVIDLLLGKE
jgi:hypothetical protein